MDNAMASNWRRSRITIKADTLVCRVNKQDRATYQVFQAHTVSFPNEKEYE